MDSEFQENQSGVPKSYLNYNEIDSKVQENGSGISIKSIWTSKIVCGTTMKSILNYNKMVLGFK